ncbi:MAG TPA: Ig-like domain-containing protein [Bacteroidota bacterium]|nr:Ig-like domain-containing protein [Bacteroidota bacterium]
MKKIIILLTIGSLFWGCEDTIVEYKYDGEQIFHNDLLHGDLIGRVLQKESGAIVIVSQVTPVDSVLINPVDGSFAFRDLRAGNYNLTIKSDNFRYYVKENIVVAGGSIQYIGEIDLSKIPDLISSYYPEDKAEIVYDWRYGRITVSMSFTQPMDRESVEKAFSIEPSAEGLFVWGQYTWQPYTGLYTRGIAEQAYRPETGATITTYSKVTSFTYVLAKKDCYPDTTYTVTLTTEAKDTAGNHLRFPLVFRFKTVQSYTTIYGIQSEPMLGDADVSPISYSGIRITFPRRMEPISTEAATRIIPSMNTMFLWPEENVMVIYPGGPFLSDTTITVSIGGEALDKDGIPLGKDYTTWFRTAPFSLQSVSPGNGQLFVSPTTNIYLTFNSFVKIGNAQNAIQIMPPVQGSFSYRGDSYYENPQTIIFTPSSSFAPNTKYTITVTTALRDLYDSPLKQSYTFSFVTRP